MTHVSNLLPTSQLNDLSFYEVSTGLFPHLNHLKILESIVYVFIHEENKKPGLLNESQKQNTKY